MKNLNKVNDALSHLYNLVLITGQFDNEERDLFYSYIQYLHSGSKCEKLIKRFKK